MNTAECFPETDRKWSEALISLSARSRRDVLAAMKSCDFLIVPSEWGKRVLALHGLLAEVVPEGFDRGIGGDASVDAAINKLRETAWRRYKRERNLDMLLSTLESLDKVETAAIAVNQTITEVNEYRERLAG